MSHTRVQYDDVEPVADGMHFLREPLDCDVLGVTVIDVEAGWTGKPHDHADRDHEEVYVLIEGTATVTVEDEAVELTPGDALRVSPEATRQIEAGEAPTRMVLVGADR